MTYNEFWEDIVVNAILLKPKEWRIGQSVFNYIDDKYGVARYVQFVEHIDCFYDDKQIELFVIACYRKYQENNLK